MPDSYVKNTSTRKKHAALFDYDLHHLPQQVLHQHSSLHNAATGFRIFCFIFTRDQFGYYTMKTGLICR